MEGADRRPREPEPVRAATPAAGRRIASRAVAGPAWLNALRPPATGPLTGVIERSPSARRRPRRRKKPGRGGAAPRRDPGRRRASLLHLAAVALHAGDHRPAPIGARPGRGGRRRRRLVLAVAEWQSTEGAGSPALAIDGKAGPRTPPRIFRGGLNVDGEGEAFGGEVQTDVIDEWATLATAEARCNRLCRTRQRAARRGRRPGDDARLRHEREQRRQLQLPDVADADRADPSRRRLDQRGRRPSPTRSTTRPATPSSGSGWPSFEPPRASRRRRSPRSSDPGTDRA